MIDLVILLLVTIAILLFRAERVLSRIARTITDRGTALPMAFDADEVIEQRDAAITQIDQRRLNLLNDDKAKNYPQSARRAQEFKDLAEFEWLLWNAMSHAYARVAAGTESINDAQRCEIACGPRSRGAEEGASTRIGEPALHAGRLNPNFWP